MTRSKWFIRDAAKATGCFDHVRFPKGKAGHAMWLKHRRNGVGGSDMAVILGLSPWSSPALIWEEKTGRRDSDDLSGKWAVAKGAHEEELLRDWYKRTHPDMFVIDGTGVSLTSREHPHMLASLDGFLYDREAGSWGILEIKTANAQAGRTQWHDQSGRLVIPPYYLAQVTHYMAVTGFTWGVVYADIGEAEPVEVRFERDMEDIAADVQAAEDFWGFVERDERPALKGVVDVPLIHPKPDGTIITDTSEQMASLLEQYDAATSAINDAKREQALLRDAIVAAIGPHEGVRAGGWQATYRAWERPAHMVKASSGRTFRLKQLKEGDK